jgi:hypothetical protein
MARELTTVSTHITKKIAYDDEYKCILDFENDCLMNYGFYKGNMRLNYLNDGELIEIRNTHWSDHYKILEKKESFTVEQLLDFNDFDKLYYVGGSTDGLVKNIKTGKYISTPIILDEIFFQVHLKLESSKAECIKILSYIDDSFLVSSKVVQIPYYNANKQSPNNHTLNLIIKIDDENYNRLLGNNKNVNDYVKIEIIKFISKDKEMIETLLQTKDEEDEED